MVRLADFFPEHRKRAFVDRNLEPGRVLYLHCEFTKPPKEKFLLLACLGEPSLLFVINSTIHPFISKKPHLLSCQVKLSSSDYGFLSHDSFVDCSQIINSLTEQAIRDQVLSDVGRIRGEINRTTKNEIIKVVGSARTISRYHKKLIIDSLK